MRKWSRPWMGMVCAVVLVLAIMAGGSAAPLAEIAEANPDLVNLRDKYFVPTGWDGKRFINYHYDWGTKQWVRHSGYTYIYNRGNPRACFGQTTLVRWDYIKTGDINNYWMGGQPLNLTFYFREDIDIHAERAVIYAPGHYPVHFCRGIPDPDTNPPANMGICGQDACPEEPGFQKACSIVHGVRSNPGEDGCKGWGSYRPYVYMPVEWDFGAWGNFHLEFTQRFHHIENYNERCYGKTEGYEVNWYVTDCYLGYYQFGDTYSCEGTVSGARPCGHRGDMVVVFQDETGPGWHGIERWYFQRDIGLVAIEGYVPATNYWYFVCLDAQW